MRERSTVIARVAELVAEPERLPELLAEATGPVRLARVHYALIALSETDAALKNIYEKVADLCSMGLDLIESPGVKAGVPELVAFAIIILRDLGKLGEKHGL